MQWPEQAEGRVMGVAGRIQGEAAALICASPPPGAWGPQCQGECVRTCVRALTSGGVCKDVTARRPLTFSSGKRVTCEGPRGGSGTWQQGRAWVRLEGSGSRVPTPRPLSCFPLQFDLQRIVIYCDARHAELETCCDIPSGPVSKDFQGEVGSKAQVSGALASGREEAPRAQEPAVGVTCDGGGGPVVSLGVCFLVQ